MKGVCNQQMISRRSRSSIDRAPEGDQQLLFLSKHGPARGAGPVPQLGQTPCGPFLDRVGGSAHASGTARAQEMSDVERAECRAGARKGGPSLFLPHQVSRCRNTAGGRRPCLEVGAPG
eukprot:CAMPEP_0202037954 /NCGR_PEP_ID=MMETSP0962-20130828/3542_1 /ASSEMBLY_ACC=CAM_ASM_000488 /TAXON_ID=4773 /ORGANISM="Schizochytrium aggregatum, Strain ATCC28209" /LENGTH=118 /DNA_ID=CAMNT_0048602089 /DNA_START=143 /DNA_END=495 /DNA_ORIENTATION=-